MVSLRVAVQVGTERKKGMAWRFRQISGWKITFQKIKTLTLPPPHTHTQERERETEKERERETERERERQTDRQRGLTNQLENT